MGGNARSNNYATGVLEDLYARVLVVEDDSARAAIVSLDLLGIWQEDAELVRAAVAGILNCSPEQVLVACTHTHSGPDMWQALLWDEEKLSRDSELLNRYREQLPGLVAEAARTALAQRQPVTMDWGTAQNRDVAHNRRLRMRDGSTRMNWELPPVEEVDRELGPIDARVSVITFRDHGDAIMGGIVHYPCHAAILAGANNLLSGDFVGMVFQVLVCSILLVSGISLLMR